MDRSLRASSRASGFALARGTAELPAAVRRRSCRPLRPGVDACVRVHLLIDTRAAQTGIIDSIQSPCDRAGLHLLSIRKTRLLAGRRTPETGIIERRERLAEETV